MKRRDLLSAFPIGVVPSAGCIQMDTQPEQVPVWVDNQTEQLQTGELEWTERETNDLFLSTEFEIESEEEEPFYAEPISAEGEYVVSVELETIREEVAVSGGRLRDIDVVIRSSDDVHIESVPM